MQARTEIRSPSPAAATIAGDGVSPAASAAASGSPPGSAAATARAEAGRARGSCAMQRTITRSTKGSISLTCEETLASGGRRESSKARLPVNISYSTTPSE